VVQCSFLRCCVDSMHVCAGILGTDRYYVMCIKRRLPIEADVANLAGWIAGTTYTQIVQDSADEAASKTEYDFPAFSSR
jgi:hypothetical protein